jgi:hypothetical protein
MNIALACPWVHAIVKQNFLCSLFVACGRAIKAVRQTAFCHLVEFFNVTIKGT